MTLNTNCKHSCCCMNILIRYLWDSQFYRMFSMVLSFNVYPVTAYRSWRHQYSYTGVVVLRRELRCRPRRLAPFLRPPLVVLASLPVTGAVVVQSSRLQPLCLRNSSRPFDWRYSGSATSKLVAITNVPCKIMTSCKQNQVLLCDWLLLSRTFVSSGMISGSTNSISSRFGISNPSSPRPKHNNG